MSGGIIQVVDPVTGDTVYRDVATGEEISRTPAVPGTPTQASGPVPGSTTTSDGGFGVSGSDKSMGGALTGPIPTAPPVPGAGYGPDPSKRLFPGSETIAGPNGTFLYHYTDGSFSSPQTKAADPTALQQQELAKLQAETNRILAGGQSASAGVSRQNELDRLAQSGSQYQQTAQATAAAAKAKAEYDQAQLAQQLHLGNQTNATNLAQLAQQLHLGNQTNATNLAQLAQQLQLANQTNATNQGNTLLGLGSRPETLIRYLYALRGQQAPQQLGGVTPALPGYPGTNALPSGGAPNVGAPSSSPVVSAAGGSSTPPALAGAAQGGSVPMLPGRTGMLTPQPASLLQNNAANPGYESNSAALAAQNPALAQQLAAARGAPSLAAPAAPPPAVQAPAIPPEVATLLGGKSNPLASLAPAPIAPAPTVQSLYPNAGPATLGGGAMPTVGQTANGMVFTGGAGNTWQNVNLPAPNTLTAAVGDNGVDPREVFAQRNAERAAMGLATVSDISKAGRYYDQGGIIPEKVVGVGVDSGQPYQFGEKGTEAVMSNEMLQKLMAVAGKVDFHSKGSDGKSQRITMTLNGPPKLDAKKKPDMPGMNSYGAGGTIGYSGGKNDYNPAVFNPPDLSSIVGRGFNTPGIPLPPQVNMLTGGGQSLIPSAQTLTNALPSEVGAYSGFLTDEAGVQPNDVFALAKRLAPKVTGVRTPSYGG